MHIALDFPGGIAGDMFIAAILDAWPEHITGLDNVIASIAIFEDIEVELINYNDGTFSGKRLNYTINNDVHVHRSYKDIVQLIEHSSLADSVQARAKALFLILAEAEAQVHGCSIDEVHFHEVGALDSILDFVIAAWLIDTLPWQSWSFGALPQGQGIINTAHGAMPVPAPAVVSILEGFSFYTDSELGERVTPTGAAILKYLSQWPERGSSMLGLGRQGFGFGTKSLKHTANVTRVVGYRTNEPSDPPNMEHFVIEPIDLIEFDIDDQTSEDLAIALNHIREASGVRDVSQYTVFGKKGRLCTVVRILIESKQFLQVARLCFIETTTTGLRRFPMQRYSLAREEIEFSNDISTLNTKVIRRPNGEITAKSDIDIVKDLDSAHGRQQKRDQITRTVIDQSGKLNDE